MGWVSEPLQEGDKEQAGAGASSSGMGLQRGAQERQPRE